MINFKITHYLMKYVKNIISYYKIFTIDYFDKLKKCCIFVTYKIYFGNNVKFISLFIYVKNKNLEMDKN